MSGHVEEGAANCRGVRDKEDFAYKRSFEVGFEGQVGVFQVKKVGNKWV